MWRLCIFKEMFSHSVADLVWTSCCFSSWRIFVTHGSFCCSASFTYQGPHSRNNPKCPSHLKFQRYSYRVKVWCCKKLNCFSFFCLSSWWTSDSVVVCFSTFSIFFVHSFVLIISSGWLVHFPNNIFLMQ